MSTTAKRYLMATLATVVAVATSLTIVLSASAELPKISVANTGGVPTFGTSKCEFSLQFEKCQVTVSNGSKFPVRILETEIAGTEGSVRYGISKVGCKKGGEIASGKTCTDEVVLNAAAVKGWSNWYFINVEEVGNPKNTAAANASLTVI